MNFFWWTLICVIIATPISEVGSDSTAYPDIPEHLLECYMDDGIYHRANRVPASFESFVDLVKKIETGRTSKNVNARELAMAMLHYLKLDGIQSIRSHTKYFPSNILPFAPSGSEYFKHRLTLVGLVPRIDQSYTRMFNETLTKKEMCNLHFMLSYSIDPYKRDDERCSPLYEDSRKKTAPASEWDLHQNVRGYQRRYRRGIDHVDDLNKVTATSKLSHLGKSLQKREIETVKRRDVRKLFSPNESEGNEKSEKVLRRMRKASANKNEDAEVLHSGVRKAEKDKFTIGAQELLSGNEYGSKKSLQSLTQMDSFGRGGYHRPMHTMDEGSVSVVLPDVPLSDCPVVNGVVSTSYGSLTIGTVIAGIAAGLNPEEIHPAKLSVDPKELESGDRIKNIWATTLAGTVADIITSSALLHANSLQILKGGWNDTNNPSWYLLTTNQFQHMPEVTLRGSIDGLLLGLNAKEWSNRSPGFKLSQMLQTYYDYLWGKVGAKNRVQLMSEHSQGDTFRKQVHLMSLVLKKQKTNVLTVLDYSHIVREATTKVNQHIQTMDEQEKSYIGSFLSTKIDNAINMIAVIDSSWGHDNLVAIFRHLRAAGVASTSESNLTIICGSNGRTLATSRNSIDFHSAFTKEALQENCTRGLNFPLAFDALSVMYRSIYYEEKKKQEMNVEALVAVLMPFDSLMQENTDIIEMSLNFKRSFPDVRLMVAANGRTDGYQQMVNSPKDAFALTAYTTVAIQGVAEFAEGVKQSYQRITRPSCGSYFDDDTSGQEVRIIRDVNPENIVYYRLAPNYFFTQHGEVVVTIRSKLKVPLTVCHSREMDRPIGPSPREAPTYPDRNNFSPDFPPEARPYAMQSEPSGPVECKTITTEPYKIVLNNPCQGAAGLRECLPLFISLTAPIQEGQRIPCPPTCRLPIGVQYEISATGLTCYNSAAAIFMSPLLILLLVIRHFY